MNKELKDKLIGREIKVIDEEFNPDTNKMEEKEVVVKVVNFMKDDTIAIVEKQAKYSQDLAGKKIKFEFTFPEKLAVNIETNKVYNRQTYQTLMNENNKVFTAKLAEAYKNLEDKNKLLFVYRHFGPINKAMFISSILIGVAFDQEDVNKIIAEDKLVYAKEANEFDKRPQKYIYSISIGKTEYIEPKED